MPKDTDWCLLSHLRFHQSYRGVQDLREEYEPPMSRWPESLRCSWNYFSCVKYLSTSIIVKNSIFFPWCLHLIYWWARGIVAAVCQWLDVRLRPIFKLVEVVGWKQWTWANFQPCKFFHLCFSAVLCFCFFSRKSDFKRTSLRESLYKPMVSDSPWPRDLPAWAGGGHRLVQPLLKQAL